MNLLGLATHVLRRGYLRARNGCLVLRAVYRNPGITIGSHVKIETNDLRLFRAGRGTMIQDYAQITVWGPDPFSPGPGGLRLGENVLICSFANVIAACGEIVIEEYCMIAQHVSLIAANHSLTPGSWYRLQPLAARKTGIHLEPNVWIGCNSVVLPGCRVGRNSVVAAGSVVTKNIPPDEIWGGVPARFMRKIASAGSRSGPADPRVPPMARG
jgi:acetyltransferase-like isoleucine patch superfamily enzyme